MHSPYTVHSPYTHIGLYTRVYARIQARTAYIACTRICSLAHIGPYSLYTVYSQYGPIPARARTDPDAVPTYLAYIRLRAHTQDIALNTGMGPYRLYIGYTGIWACSRIPLYIAQIQACTRISPYRPIPGYSPNSRIWPYIAYMGLPLYIAQYSPNTGLYTRIAGLDMGPYRAQIGLK